MANRQRAEARRKAQAKAARSGDGEGGGMNKLYIWAALGLVLVLGVGIALFVSGDDSKSVTADSQTTVVSGLPDSQPVTVIGEALPAFANDGQADPAIGLDAPMIEGLNFVGETITADATTNGAYMLVFLAHWCPHCNAEVPRLNDWKHSGAVPPELDVIGVATAASPSSANYPPASWFSNMGWEWPVMVDESQGDGTAGTAAQAFGATGWPYGVIVGADGKVKARFSGEIEPADLQAIVDDALAS
ncbi:MAG TPA: TlpA disulfide reductase family protein [Ilumatobacteraceae bacterium]|nr:TlpA disulfide reductase family protein [Ilumatobacteraceae bacterium]HRA85721.1 TlpA disulfide reductase family protein [Ilumatobacteraceae bacterium]